jgi:hypothetical protein
VSVRTCFPSDLRLGVGLVSRRFRFASAQAKAREEFEKAVEERKTAALVEQRKPDVFSVRAVGCVVTLRLCAYAESCLL